MRRNIAIVLFILTFAVLFAQPYGSVGDVPIDDLFLQTLQFVHPEFSFTPDSVAFSGKLQKLYIYDRGFADEARKLGLDKNPEVQKYLERITRLIEDSYLARIYEQQLSKQKVTASEKEARDYYDNNITQFTEPGTYSYLWASLHDTSDANIRDVREKLKTYMKLGTALDEFKMGSPETYSMAFEKERTIRPDDHMYHEIHDGEPGEIIGPFFSGEKMMMIVLIDKTPEKVTPFSEVAELCRQNVISEKANAMIQETREKALSEYPINLNKSFFSGSK